MAVRTIAGSGPNANRIDMIFMGDGYTAAETATFTAHIQSYLSYIFDDTALTQPFGRYENFFKIYAIDTASNQSGADNPGTGTVRDTAFDATYFFDGATDRLLYVNDAKAQAAMNAALAGTGVSGEMRYMLVNDATYGGGGGYFGTYAGGNDSAREVALHEIAHSFVGLGDEYGGDPGLYAGGEPPPLNVSLNSTGADWAEWLGYVDPDLGTVGAYQGGFYFEQGVWRPTLDSKMRDLGRAFDPIAREEFIHKFYQFVDPLDGFDNNVGTKSGIAALAVDVIDPAVIKVDWTVNGTLFANAGENFNFAAHGIGGGTYTVTARAYDDTPWVRGDRSDLEQSVSWSVVLTGPATDVSLSNATAPEGSAPGVIVGALTIVGGSGAVLTDDAGGRFALSGANLTVVGGLDFELAASHNVTLRVTGTGGFFDKTFAIAVGDVADTNGDDAGNVISGGAAAELIQGRGGGDALFGAFWDGSQPSGADTLDGGAGNDGMWGLDGDDILIGGAGSDGLVGGDGADRLYGGADVDFLFGGSFTPEGAFAPGSGDDLLMGGEGNDGLWGFDGKDQIFGDVGNDYVEGGEGDDGLDGGGDSDVLLGQAGNDTIRGGAGFDYLYGGTGADIFEFRKDDLYDMIWDFSKAEGDRLKLDPALASGFAAFQAQIAGFNFEGVDYTVFYSADLRDRLTIKGVAVADWTAEMLV